MKLNNDTLEVLQNAASINPNLIVDAGNTIRSVTDSKSLAMEATVNENFPVPFAIYEMQSFLNAHGLLDEPDLEFKEDHVSISDNNSSVNYYFADRDMMTSAPVIDNIVEKLSGTTPVEFKLTQSAMKQLSKACGVLKIKKIRFESDGKGVTAVIQNDNKKTNHFTAKLSDESTDNFSFTASFDNLKFMPGDYNVKFFNGQIAVGLFELDSEDVTVRYLVAFEDK